MREYTELTHLEFSCLQSKQNRIGLLGGTFNPIHNGHLSMAYISLYEFSLGEIIFLPLGTPPHKKNEYIASNQSRLDMIRLAIAAEPRFSVNTLELNRNGYTYTVDTLEILTRENLNSEYYFIIGADTLFELHTWKNCERVFFLTSFICILRPGQDDLCVKQYIEKLNQKYGYKFFLAHERGPDISSSLIRAMSARGEFPEEYVPEDVARYLIDKRIYCEED